MVNRDVLVMSFSLYDVLPGWVGTAAEFFLGDDRSLGGKGAENRGLLGSGADSFLRNIKTTEGTAASRSAAEQRRITMDVPRLTGTAPGGRARVQGVAQDRLFAGSTIPQIQSAIRNGMSGNSRNAQLSNLWSRYQVQRNMPINRRTVGLEAPKVAGATQTKAATVRVMKDTV